MVIGGVQRLSLSDFPGRIAAIVFTRGCNFKCPYCHNPELVDPALYGESVAQAEVLRFLEARRDVLQGLVVSGGEPTLHEDLPALLRAARDMGLATKLDTNGSLPARLEHVLTAGLVDYIALDIKAPWHSYSRVAGLPVDPADIAASLRLVIESGVDHEIRTTYGRQFLAPAELQEIAVMIQGCRRFALQGFRPSKSLDPNVLAGSSALPAELEEARRIFESAGVVVNVR